MTERRVPTEEECWNEFWDILAEWVVRKERQAKSAQGGD